MPLRTRRAAPPAMTDGRSAVLACRTAAAAAAATLHTAVLCGLTRKKMVL